MLSADDELTPMQFLRQLAFENAQLTDQFTKYYTQAPASSCSESSDDDTEFAATQSTVSGSSQRTLSQKSVLGSDNHEMDGIEQMAGSSFDYTNGDQQNFDSHMDTSMHVDDVSAESSFENTNVAQPIVNPSIQVDSLPTRSFEAQPSTSGLQTTMSTPDGIVLRKFSIVAPSVKMAMEKLKKEKEKKKKAEDEARQKLLALLEANDEPEVLEGHCKICKLGVMCNMAFKPCGHTCCNSCWRTQCAEHKAKCEKADLSPADIALKISQPTCFFCRTIVTETISIFFS